MNWNFHHPRALDLVGYIPQFLSEEDPRPAREQFNDAYRHGGGWSPFGEGKWKHKGNFLIQYPGDPMYVPVATAKLRDETIVVYPHAWVGIFQPDGSFEIARMD